MIDPPGWGRNADYPEVLEARQAGILEVIEDEFERAKAAGLTGEDLTWHLARVIGGARPSKTAAGQSRMNDGGEPRLGRGGAGPMIEGF